MKKKVVILSTISALALGSAFAAVLALKHNNFLAPAKASDKSFTFNETVGANQFDGKYEAQRAAEISVVTGVGSNLETNIRLPKYPSNPSSEEDYGTWYGHSGTGRFVHNGETISSSYFVAEIGVNNLTSIEVVYGCDKTEYTHATSVYCYIDVYDEVGGWHNDISCSSGDAFNLDLDLTWAKTTETYTVSAVRVKVGADGGSVYYGEPLYIKTMTLNWSC